jgi:hypothetical protein
MSPEVINGEHYAVVNHDVKHSKKTSPSIAQDVTDIFDSVVERTEREFLVLARISQGKFRQNVIDAWGNGKCCVLTFTNIRLILIAPHIVPWYRCESN